MQLLALVALSIPLQVHGTASPIAKVISMLSDLQAKVIKEGDVAQAEFKQFTEWCEDRSRNLGFEIKTGKSGVEELKAAISEEVALTQSLTSKVEELSAGIATDEADLKAATGIRGKEKADFDVEEKELMETVDILKRAIQILERQMQSGGSMLQVRNARSLTQALSAMVQASMIGTSDVSRLTAFVQSVQTTDEDDAEGETGAPAGAVYKSRSGSIVDTLEDLLDKAETQLDATRQKETAATHNYEMLKQSLEDEISVANKDLDEAKKNMAGSAERKSTAQGDLQATSKELKSDEEVKASLHQDCMDRAQEFEASTKSRGEELKALAEAKKVIQEATGGAALDQVSFFQIARSGLNSGEDLANFEAVRLVRDLARKQHSSLLAQLASRMATVMRTSADPFGKVKGLITDMIAKLEQEAGADATKKAYCDKELKETKAKKLEKSTQIEMLSTRIDQMSAKSAKLKEEVAALQNELAKLAKSQAEMDKMRAEEKESYTVSRAEQEKGLEGIKLGLKVLKEYYAKSDAAHGAASGAASGIMGLLETIESDMTKTLAELITEEESAVDEYERMTQRNNIDQASKEQDVKYKTKESKQLDKDTAESKGDRSGLQAELDAVLEYLAKIEEQCIAKPEAYAERARRRKAEIAGLKEALQILESETSLLQRLTRGRRLRGGALTRTQ